MLCSEIEALYFILKAFNERKIPFQPLKPERLEKTCFIAKVEDRHT